VNIHKKASIKTAAELGATVGGVFGPIGAAIGGGKDHRARPFLGAVAGGMIGGLGGMALGPVASRIGATAGSIAGANLGYRSRKDALKAQLGEDKYKAMYPEHQKTLQDHVNGYKQ
jgi:outer membrane lipoprotein SlyB